MEESIAEEEEEKIKHFRWFGRRALRSLLEKKNLRLYFALIAFDVFTYNTNDQFLYGKCDW